MMKSRTRSQSQRRKAKKEAAAQKKVDEQTEANILQPFGTGVTGGAGPWTATTPTRTVQALLPTPPVENSVEAMGSAEDKEDATVVSSALDKLKKTLEEKGFNDGEILGQIMNLEKMSKDTTPQPALTHKSLNQLQKAEKQYLANKTAIKELDSKWNTWSDLMKEKFQEQGALYKEQRGILMEKHREMKTKLVQLRVEMQKAAIQQKDLQVEEDIVAIPDVSFDQELVVSSGDEEMKDPEEAKGKRGTKNPAGAAQASPSKLPKVSAKWMQSLSTTMFPPCSTTRTMLRRDSTSLHHWTALVNGTPNHGPCTLGILCVRPEGG